MESRRYQAEASSFLSTCPVPIAQTVLNSPSTNMWQYVWGVASEAHHKGSITWACRACITDLNSSVSSPRHPAGTEWPKGFITQSHSCQAGNSESSDFISQPLVKGHSWSPLEYMKFGHLSPATLIFPWDLLIYMSSLMITSIFTMWVVFPQLGWRVLS